MNHMKWYTIKHLLGSTSCDFRCVAYITLPMHIPTMPWLVSKGFAYHLWRWLENWRWIFTPWKFNTVPNNLPFQKENGHLPIIFQGRFLLNFQGRFITLSLRIKGFPLSCYSQLRSNRWTYPWDGPVHSRSIPLLNSLILRLCAFSYICCPFFQMKVNMNMSRSYMSHSVPIITKWETHHPKRKSLPWGILRWVPKHHLPHCTTHPPICHVTMACHHWKLTTLWPARVVHHWPARSACLPSASQNHGVRGFCEKS